MQIKTLKTNILLILISVLLSCQNPNRQVLGVWESSNHYTKSKVSKLSVSHKHGLYWYTSGADSSRYHYSLYSDSLELMNYQGVYNYRIAKLTKKQMIWQSMDEKDVNLYFRKISKHPLSSQSKSKNVLPMLKDINDLMFALTGPNVELRLKNLLHEFSEGDYLRNPTLYHLTGVSPSRKYGELPDAESHRRLISEIEEIRRVGDHFQLKLAGQENLRTSIPIYKYERGERELQTVLDLFIRKDAVINLKPTVEGVKIDIDGVRVGKGWLKIGLPTFRISGDYGNLLGFKFRLSR